MGNFYLGFILIAFSWRRQVVLNGVKPMYHKGVYLCQGHLDYLELQTLVTAKEGTNTRLLAT
jgi:hypothetical protein